MIEAMGWKGGEISEGEEGRGDGGKAKGVKEGIEGGKGRWNQVERGGREVRKDARGLERAVWQVNGGLPGRAASTSFPRRVAEERSGCVLARWGTSGMRDGLRKSAWGIGMGHRDGIGKCIAA